MRKLYFAQILFIFQFQSGNIIIINSDEYYIFLNNADLQKLFEWWNDKSYSISFTTRANNKFFES